MPFERVHRPVSVAEGIKLMNARMEYNPNNRFGESLIVAFVPGNLARSTVCSIEDLFTDPAGNGDRVSLLSYENDTRRFVEDRYPTYFGDINTNLDALEAHRITNLHVSFNRLGDQVLTAHCDHLWLIVDPALSAEDVRHWLLTQKWEKVSDYTAVQTKRHMLAPWDGTVGL